MDRALDLAALTTALQQHQRLPQPSELQELLLQTELALFAGRDNFDERLLHAAWYLHAIATSPSADALRRREAARVSAHVFDVYLQIQGAQLPEPAYRRHAIASQVGYMLGDTAPNAIAVGARRPLPNSDILTEPGQVSLHAATLLLNLDLRQLTERVNAARERLASELPPDDGATTLGPSASAADTLEGIASLRDYLFSGDEDERRSASNAFHRAINNSNALHDTDSRWVAALLLDIGEYMGRASLWALLPTGDPRLQRAFRERPLAWWGFGVLRASTRG